MTVQAMKLVTGEELVAEVISVSADQVTIKDPLVMVTQMGKEGFTCRFMPWTIISEGNLWLQPSGIVARYNVPKDVQDSYLSNTSGIQITSAMPQILQG